MDNVRYTDESGNIINVSVMGFFTVPELEKEYVMYAMVDENPNNDMGNVLLGEVVREEDNIQILGILSEEKDLVVAYYNEISNQLGGDL